MRFGIERNIITKQTVMNEAVDGETERGAAGGVRLLRRRGGREGEPGGSTMPFSAFEAGNTRKFAPTHAA